ncbi:MAG: STAS domain-containing protein [Solirubrobacteraceae bacterium]
MTDTAQGPEAAALAPETFSIVVEPDRETVLLAVAGELDLATGPQLVREVDELADAGFARLVIDLRHLTFLDASGLHAILDAHARSTREAGSWRSSPGPGRCSESSSSPTPLNRLPFTAATTSRRPFTAAFS